MLGFQVTTKGRISKLRKTSWKVIVRHILKDAGSKRKKPAEPVAIRRVFREKVLKDIAHYRHSIHQKKAPPRDFAAKIGRP